MFSYFLAAYADLVAALVAAGGPVPNAPLGNLQRDNRATEDWLRHLRLNLQLYSRQDNPQKLAAVKAVLAAADTWESHVMTRQVVYELFIATRDTYRDRCGDEALHCILTEKQALILYQHELLDCRTHKKTYAAWLHDGVAFGLPFSIGYRFCIDR